MGDEAATMVTAAGIPRAHIMKPPMEGVPPHISSYLRVVDVDAKTQLAVDNGGTLINAPTDIPPGRFSVVQSPSGAVFCLFHEADEASAQNAPKGDGAIHWVELHSTDVDSDVTWLKSSFDLTTDSMAMPDGSTYYILKDGDVQVGGVMKGMNPNAPSFWLVWVAVPDIDDCVERVKNSGGQAFGDAMDMPGIGRMAVVTDPAGAAFGVITPAVS